MTIPLWTLLGFAIWTILVLAGTVGVYRWSRILTGAMPIHAFRADVVTGEDWYRRAMRAHANCVENLPVYGALVMIASSIGLTGRTLDVLAITVLVARVCQTLVHLSFVETKRTVSIRFSFFTVQVICMLGIAALLILAATVKIGN